MRRKKELTKKRFFAKLIQFHFLLRRIFKSYIKSFFHLRSRPSPVHIFRTNTFLLLLLMSIKTHVQDEGLKRRLDCLLFTMSENLSFAFSTLCLSLSVPRYFVTLSNCAVSIFHLLPRYFFNSTSTLPIWHVINLCYFVLMLEVTGNEPSTLLSCG